MTDYLGPLTLGTSGTYQLLSWSSSASDTTLEATVKVAVVAASSDALAAAIEALAAQVRQGNVYARSWPGVTYPVVYSVASSGGLELEDSDEGTTWLGSHQVVTFTLTLTEQPAGALTTLYNAQALSAPDALTLAALLGTRPPQLDVTVDDSSGNDMHSVWCALAPRVLTNDQSLALSRGHWLVLASSLTWTTMSNGTGATSWGNAYRYTTSASWQTAPLDTSGYPSGKYKLLARVAQSAGTGYVSTDVTNNPIAVTRTTPHLLELGDIDLPVSDTAHGTASNLTLYARSDGTNTLYVNAFVLLPLAHGMFAYHASAATTEIDQIDCGPSGVFLDGTTNFADVAPADVLRPTILAAHTGTLVATASPSGSNWPSDWDKTSSGVSADTSRFKCVGASKYAWYAATNAATPLVVPGEWYELTFTRDVDSYVAGNATVSVVWQDVDGSAIRTDVLSTVAANDAAPATLSVYGKAPVHAARAQVKLGTDGTGNMTVYWSAVAFRRCPLQLLVVAEDAAGALSSYLHPVAVTVRYRAMYEVAR